MKYQKLNQNLKNYIKIIKKKVKKKKKKKKSNNFNKSQMKI